MRKWIVAALTAGALLVAFAVAIAPGASASNRMVVCPLASGLETCCGPPVAVGAGPASIPCCLVPAATCCGPAPTEPGCCGPGLCTTISLAAAPDPAQAGQTVTLQGTVSTSAATVTLWERQAGQAAFAQVATVKPNASGAFQFSRPVETDVEWYATAGTATSATLSEPVEAAISAHASRAPALSATVVPSHAGASVAVQQRHGRRWVTIARPVLDANSHFSLALSVHRHRRGRFRVVLAADARNARSVSRTVVMG